MINVSINDRKRFEWEGGADAVAHQEMARLAAIGDTTPMTLAQSMVKILLEHGRFISDANQETQMLMWLLLSKEKTHVGSKQVAEARFNKSA